MSDYDIQQQASINTLGRYKILRRIGRGGMGDVWLCEDPRLNRQVAVKTLPVHNQQDREFALRFEREAQAAAALHHPHILPVHDYGRQPLPNGNIITYIVMPYVGGGSLAEHLTSYEQKRSLIPAQEALDFLFQAADAIDYAHSQQVIHRDIKPGNMLLRDENWLLLADFGIARILTTEDRLTATGPGFGTPEYMAPEQAHGQAEPASDNYSLAVIAYQMFAGRLPFEADTSYAVTIQHLTQPPPPPARFNPTLSLAFEEALLQGLAKQPAERLASARAFVTALGNTLTNAPFEVTYSKTALPSTIGRVIRPESNQDIAAQETKRVDASDPAGLTTTMPTRSPVTRRSLLIGGGALAIAGGLGAWGLISAHNSQQVSTISQPTPAVSKTPNPNGPLLILRGHNKPATSLTWAPQKSVLVSASDGDGNALLWGNINQLIQQSQKTVTQYIDHDLFSPGYSPMAVWSPDSKSLALGNVERQGDKGVVEINTLSNDLHFSRSAPRITVPEDVNLYGLAWLPNNKLITLSQPGTLQSTQSMLRLWDMTHREIQPQPAILQTRFSSSLLLLNTSLIFNMVAASPDGSQLALLSSDSTVHVGRISSLEGKTIWQESVRLQFSTDPIQTPMDPIGVGWSANGNKIVALTSDFSGRRLTFWNWRESKPQPHASGIPGDDANVAFSALATNPASSDFSFATGNKNGIVYLWKFTEGASPARMLDTSNITNSVSALAWSKDGHYLAASFADTDASILIWKI